MIELLAPALVACLLLASILCSTVNRLLRHTGKIVGIIDQQLPGVGRILYLMLKTCLDSGKLLLDCLESSLCCRSDLD